MKQPNFLPKLAQSRYVRIQCAKWFAVIGFIVAAASLSASVVRYAVLATGAVREPYGIDYGEGIVWQQMNMIMAGNGYGSIKGFPAIVFHYPPLYHVITALFASATNIDQLEVGRSVSVMATIILASFITLIAVELREAKESKSVYLLGGVAAAAILFATKPVVMWSYLMRVDMLSLAFSFAGVWLSIKALKHPKLINVASLCFVMAIFTKQTALAAPIPVFAIMTIAHPRTAMMGIVTGALTALVGLVIMMGLTNGGFLHHILFYNINRFSFTQWYMIQKAIGPELGFLIVAVWTINRQLRRFAGVNSYVKLKNTIKQSESTAALAILLAYSVISVVMLVLAFKSGAAINYLLEFICLVSLFSGLAVVEFAMPQSGSSEGQKTNTAICFMPWLLAVQAILLLAFVKTDYEARSRDHVDLAKLVTTIRDAPGPVVGDDMVGIIRAGKSVLWEPSIFAELASTGAWDERPFISMIQAHRFAFFINDEQLNNPKKPDSRYTLTVAHAIVTAYPQVRYLAQYELHFPAKPLPAYAITLPIMPPADHRRK